MTDSSPDKTPLLGVDWLKAVAGALAAVSTTVLLSTLGAAGTLIGAAVGSIAATVATAVYSQGLDRSRARVRQLAVRPGAFPVDPGAPVEPAPAPVPDTPPVRRAGWLDRLRGLRWGRVVPAALVMFVVVIAAVTIFELASGRTLASTVRGDDSSGTTLSHVTGTSGGSKHRTPTPSESATPSAEPSTSTSSPSPSASASASQSSSPSAEPSESPTPSEETTPTPTETPTPTADGTPSASPADGAAAQ
jgi:hypothetical protein